MLPGSASSLDWLSLTLGLAVTAMALACYIRTAARDIVVGDTPEFVTVAITLGVAHPPGYPLAALLGHVLSLVPLGPLPFRVNLLAVAAGAGTVWLVYLTAWQLTRSRMASALAALVLAFNPLFWTWSLVAEAFPLNNFLAAAMLFLLVRWHAEPAHNVSLLLAGLVGGLALSNHLTIALLAPAVLLLLWRERARLLARRRVLVVSLGAALLGLVPYAYLFWAAARHPFLNWGSITTIGDLLAHLSRQSYGAARLVSDAAYQGGEPLERIAALLSSFTPLEALLIVLGVVEAYRRARWYLWLSGFAFLSSGPAFAAYANLDLSAPGATFVLERFFLLPHVVCAPLMALGALFARDLAAAAFQLAPRLAEVALTGALLSASLASIPLNFAAVDQSENQIARHFAEDILATMEPGAILLAGGDEVVLPLAYVQAVEGYRPDVTLVMLPLLTADWYVRQLRERDPDLVIPFSRYDGVSGTLRALVEANRRRPVALVGRPTDDSLKGSYWYYGRGLVLEIKPMNEDVKLATMAADNDSLTALYRTPSADAIRPRSFERGILRSYALPAYRVAREYETAKLYGTAREWYARALAVDPGLAQAREAMARLPP